MADLSIASTIAILERVKRRLVLPEPLHKMVNTDKPAFECPLCEYTGPFRTYRPGTGKRLHAQCPRCRSLERHRAQRIVLEKIIAKRTPSDTRVLHFAPEKYQQRYFEKLGLAEYVTADLLRKDVDRQVDMCDLPMADNSYDIVYASHVLEHIPDDKAAISEVARVLKPGGMAILPVPVIQTTTVEYDEPNAVEEYHVRAIGEDYFERYKKHFKTVEVYTSEDLPESAQCYVYENRMDVPNEKFPNRMPMEGERHKDFTPVCTK